MSFARAFRHRRLVIAAVVLVFLLSVLIATRIGFENDVMKILPAQEEAIGDYLEVLDYFAGLDHMLVDVSLKGSNFDSRTTAAAMEFASRLEKSALVSEVRARIGFEELAGAYEVLASHRPELFSAQVEAEVNAALAEDAIATRLDEIRRQLVNFPDPVSARMFRADPLGLDPVFLGLLPLPSDTAEKSVMLDGWLWDSAGEHLLVTATPVRTDLDSERSRELLADVEEAIRGARSRYPDVEFAHLSRFRAALDNEVIVKGDIARTLWLSLAGIAIVLVTVLGVRWVTLLVFLPAVIGGPVAVAALALCYGKVSPIVVGCGSILLGISVDYGIHLVYAGLNNPAGGAGALRSTRRPILLAAMTTGIAFLSLQVSVLPGHRQLGVFAAAGVLAAAAGALLLLPILLPSQGRERPMTSLLSMRVEGVIQWVQGRRLVVFGAVLLATAVAGAGLWRLNIESNLERFNALSPAAAADSEVLTRTWGSSFGLTSLVVSAPTVDEALGRAAALESWLAEHVDHGRIDVVQGISGILPDRQTQVANRDRWSAFWSAERIREVRTAFEAELSERGFQPAAFRDYWLRLKAGVEGRPDLVLGDFRDTPLEQIVGTMLNTDENGTTRILTRCRVNQGEDFEAWASEVKDAFPGIVIADGAQMMRRLSDLVYRELRTMSLVSFAAVMLFLLPFSRTWRQPLVLVVVLVVTFVWTLGVMAWCGVSVNMMNSMLAIFIFGLTVDYAIFLMHATGGSGERPGHIAAAVVASSLTTLFGFGALVLARHPSLTSIGVTTVIGIACGLGASLLIVPVASSLSADQRKR